MMGELQDIKVLLRDDLYESKDWRYSDTLGRVEWLIGMVASKNEEIEMWLEQIEQIEQLREALNEAHHQLDYWQKMASPTIKFTLRT